MSDLQLCDNEDEDDDGLMERADVERAIEEAELAIRGAEADLAYDEFVRWLGRAGRANGLYLLEYALYYDALDHEVLCQVVPQVWSLATSPEETLGRERSLELFDAIGFTVNGEPTLRPSSPTLLYRGAPARYRRRMSWTRSVAVAERFASHHRSDGLRGQVWVTLAPPEATLCVLEGCGRPEHEYVVDPTYLVIRAAGRPATTPQALHQRAMSDGELEFGAVKPLGTPESSM